MDSRTRIKEAEESDAGKKKTSPGSSIFSTILADIEQNPTILHKQKNLSSAVFSTILADIDEENPKIVQEMNKRLPKTPVDFTRTVSQTLTHVDILNQELKILKSEMESKGQKSDRFVSPKPNYGRECDYMEGGKVERREEVKYLADGSDLKSDISTVILENSDEMVSTMLKDENEQVNKAQGDGDFDEFIEKMLAKIENDGSYLERIKDDYEYGDFIEYLLGEKLREKSDKEEKEFSSWITNGEPEVDIEMVSTMLKDEEKRETMKKKSPVKVTLERSEQESTVTKRDYIRYSRRLYLIEKLRERDENLMKRRVKACRFGVEFSFLVAEYMFLIPNEMDLSKLEVNGDDKGTSVIIGKLEEVFEIVFRKEHHNMNILESTFPFDEIIPLCVDAIQSLGKIVWALRSSQRKRPKLSDLDYLFEDCQRVLMKIELKLAEMKLERRVNAGNSFRRSVIGSYLVQIWKSLFKAEALQEQCKEE